MAASPALAQRGRGGLGPLSLAVNTSVQEELKLTDDQKSKIEELSKTTQATVQEKTKDLTGDERRTKMAAIMKEVNEATEKSLAGLLKDDQLKRLKQLRLQVDGVRAFGNEDTLKALKFSEEQTKEAQAMLDAAQKQIQEETKDIPRQEFQKRRGITQKINKETMGKVTEKLSDEQKKAWKELTGEPFQVKFERP